MTPYFAHQHRREMQIIPPPVGLAGRFAVAIRYLGLALQVALAAVVPLTAAAQTLPVVTVVAKDARVIGGSGREPAVFILSRTGATTADLEVDITMGGDVNAYLNYGNRPRDFTIPASESSAELSVVTSSQSSGDANTMSLTIDASSRYTVGDPSMASVVVAQFADRGPPTGELTVSGTPEVGETLEIDTSQIDDPDGLTRVNWFYGWQRSENSSGTPKQTIGGAEDRQYTLTNADSGKYIRAYVSLNDDRGNNYRIDGDWAAVAELPVVSIASPSVSTVAEDASLVFTVTLSALSSDTVEIPYELSGTAVEDVDYTDDTSTGSPPTSGSPLTISAGSVTGTITLTLTDDMLDEAEETVTVRLTGTPTNALLSDTSSELSATGTITDNDDPPEVSVARTSDESVAEGTSLEFTFELTEPSGRPVTVTFTLGGTASALDYTATPADQVEIAEGDTTATLTIDSTNDILDEEDESVTVTLGTTLTGAEPASDLARRMAEGTIVDNDAPPEVVVIRSGAAMVSEGMSLEFRFSLTAPSGRTVTVPYRLGGTATAPDYTATPASQVEIAEGDTTATLTIDTEDDSLDEEDETVTVSLGSNLVGAEPATAASERSASGTIIDNDNPPEVSVSLTGAPTVAEGGNLVFTVALTPASGRQVTVPYTLEGTAVEGEDYTDSTSSGSPPVTGSPLTIPAGSTTGTVTLALIDDMMDENDETVVVRLTGTPTSAVHSSMPSDLVATGRITGSANLPTVSVSGPSSAVAEDGSLVFTVTLSRTSSHVVTIPYMLTGTAVEGEDYTDTTRTGTPAVNGSPLTIPAGSDTGTITLSLTDDALDEDDETVIVTLSGVPSNAEHSGTASDLTSTGTIVDNDDLPEVSVALTGAATVAEGGNLVFTFTLTSASGRLVTVPYMLTGTATSGDYTAAPASQVEFATGETTATLTITTIVDKTDEEIDETVIVTLGSPLTNASLATSQAEQSATGAIADGGGPPIVSIAGTASAVAEGGSLVLTVTLSAESAQTVTVPYEIGGTATSSDYSVNPSSPLIFMPADSPAGSAAETSKNITVNATDDYISDDGETLTITLASPTGGEATLGANSSRTITITSHDPDNPPAQGEETPVVVAKPPAISRDSESGDTTAEFVITLDRPLDYAVVVPYVISLESAVAGAGSQARSSGPSRPLVDLKSGSFSFGVQETEASESITFSEGDSMGKSQMLSIRLGEPALASTETASLEKTLPEIAVPSSIAEDVTEDGVLVAVHRLTSSTDEVSRAPTQAMSALGRAHSTGIVGALWSRADALNVRHDSALAMVGGRNVDIESLRAGEGAGQTASEMARLIGVDVIAPGDAPPQQTKIIHSADGLASFRRWANLPSRRDLAGGSKFAIPLNHGNERQGAFTMWGHASLIQFEGETGEMDSEADPLLSADGSTTAFHFGVDRKFQSEAAIGVALSRSSGSVDYSIEDDQSDGTVETSITSVTPYVRWSMSGTMRSWAAAGVGSGTATLTESGRESIETDISTTLIAGGLRGELGFAGRIALKADVFVAGIEAEAVDGQLEEVSADASRIRVAGERARGRSLSGGGSFASRFELGARLDSGDDLDGFGADVSAGFSFVNSSGSLKMDGRGGLLLFHGQSGSGELGVGFGVAYSPGSGGRGLHLSLEPRWNESLTEFGSEKWDVRSGIDTGSSSDREMAVKARIGHGMGVLRDTALITAFSELEMEGERRLRVGAEFGTGSESGGLRMDLFGERHDGTKGLDDAVMLRLMISL